MAGQVIRYLAEWLIIAFILFALFFETILHKLEHWVVEHHKHLQAVLRNLYREIMILGVISFGFIMFIFVKDPSDNVKMTFEVSHVWLFLFACFHTIIVTVTVFISLRLSARWKTLERMEIVKYLELKASYLKLSEKRNSKTSFIWRHFGWWATNPSRYFTFRKLHSIMTFHDLRYQLIYYRNLRPDFNFSKMLRKIKFASMIELVEIHPVNWIILLALVGLDLIRNGVGSHQNFEPFFLMAHSVFNILLVTILARKIHNIYWKMTKNPMIYYDSIDPHAFRAELKIAEEEARIRGKTPRTSIQRPAPAEPRPSKDHGHGHFVPVHQNMAYVPGKHGHGEASHDPRYSLDVEKVRNGQNMTSADGFAEGERPGQLSHMGPTALNLLDKARKVHERKPLHERMSLDMAVAIPEKELGLRAQPAHEPFDYNEEDLAMLQHMSSQRRKLRIEAMRRLRERKARNAAIVETAQDLQAAQAAAPRRKYPKFLVKCFPRLGRVSSATEKLFWLGSHRFYIFLVEFAMFYTNVNLSTCIAKLAFYYKELAEYNKYKSKGAGKNVANAAKFIIQESVRAAAKGATYKKEPPKDNSLLLIIALVTAVVALGYVLLRIAGIMKKYIFVLNNANLLPEDMIIETIEHINLNDMMSAETMDTSRDNMPDYDSDSGTEAEELEGPNYKSMRRNMSAFLEKEQQGNANITPKSPLLPNDDFVVSLE